MELNRKEVIVIKYGELWLKSENVKRLFINRLSLFLRQKVKEYNIRAEFIWKRDHGLVMYEKKDENLLLHLLSLTPGITQYHKVYMFEFDDFEGMWRRVDGLLGKEISKAETFAVRCKRSGKHGFSSKDVEKYIGARVVEKYKKKVDLDNPDITIRLEIRQSAVYIILQTYEGVKGLPPLSSGEVVAYVENNKESLVMLYELFKRGIRVLVAWSDEPNKEIRSFISFISPVILNKKSIDDVMKEYKAVAFPLTDVKDIEEIYKKSSNSPLYPLLLFPLMAQSRDEIESKYKKIKQTLAKIGE